MGEVGGGLPAHMSDSTVSGLCRLWLAPLDIVHDCGEKRAYSAATPVACCVYILTQVSISPSAVRRSRAAFGESGR